MTVPSSCARVRARVRVRVTVTVTVRVCGPGAGEGEGRRLQEGLLAEAEEELLHQPLHQRGARLGGERGEPGGADDGRAREDAAEEHVALLGALHRALQLH